MAGQPDSSKTKLTADVHRALVKAVSDSLPLRFAAEACDLDERTVQRWLAEGKKPGGDPACCRLCRDIKKARAEAVRARLRRLTRAARKWWQADTWVLERQYPEEFGSDRRELADLRREVRYLADELAASRGRAGGQGGETPPAGPPPPPPGDGAGPGPA